MKNTDTDSIFIQFIGVNPVHLRLNFVKGELGDTARIRALIKEGREFLKAIATLPPTSSAPRAPRRAATPPAPVPDPA